MLKKEKILDLEKRKKIYNLILKVPGLHLREIEREFDFSFGTLRYHINYLVKNKLINTKKDGGFIRYYVSENVGNRDKDLLSAFRQPMLRKMIVILIMCSDKKIFFKEDFKNLPILREWYNAERFVLLKHRTTLEFHLKKLIEYDIVKVVKIKRKTAYFFDKEEEIIDFMIRYNKALPYKYVNGVLYWSNKLIIPRIVDNVLDEVNELFPNPYYV